MTENKSKDKYAHVTCTGNKRFGSGDGSEIAGISDDDFLETFGFVPKKLSDRFILAEQLLAKNRNK